MKKINSYILRNHVGPFIFGTVTVLFLFIFQFLLKFIDQIVGKGLSEWVIIQLIALNTAWMLVLSIPMGVLFSTLMAFGTMSASHEVTIIKASGGSLIRMMLPVMAAALMVTLFTFWFNDEILPEANHRAKILMSDIKRKKPTFSIEAGQFSTALDGYTILSRQVDSLSGKLKGVTIYDNTKRNSINIVNADSGTVKFNEDFTKLVMDLKHGEIHQLAPIDLKAYRKVKFEDYKILIDAKGFTLNQTNENMMSRGDREMHIRDMSKIVDDAREKAKTADSNMRIILMEHYEYLRSGYVKPKPEQERKISKRDSMRRANRLDYKRLAEGGNGKQKASKAAKDAISQKDAGLSKTDTSFGKLKNRRDAKLVSSASDSPDISPKRKRKTRRDTSRKSVLQAMQRKLSYNKSDVSPHMYQARDYNNKARQYEVEIHKKYSIPFACFVFIFVGCPLGVMSRRGNFGISAAISLGFYIVYWACLILGEKLADRGIMSPMLSMWLGNIIVGLMGVYLTIKVNNESFIFPGSKYILKFFNSVRTIFKK